MVISDDWKRCHIIARSAIEFACILSVESHTHAHRRFITLALISTRLFHSLALYLCQSVVIGHWLFIVWYYRLCFLLCAGSAQENSPKSNKITSWLISVEAINECHTYADEHSIDSIGSTGLFWSNFADAARTLWLPMFSTFQDFRSFFSFQIAK